MHISFRNSSAQGTIEYLVILAIVVVIGLVVVGLLINQVDSSSNVSSTSGEIAGKVGVGGLSLGSSVAGADTNGLLVLKNINVENLVLSKIVVDGVDHNFSTQLVSGDEKGFMLQGVASCVGEKKNYSIKVEYVSASGLTKVADFGNVSLDCTNIVTPVKVAVEETISAPSAVHCTGGTISFDGDYTVHSFLSSGTLECTDGVDAEVLVVAGGGGGGQNRGGGGGAGGLIYNNSYSISAGSYNVVVGNGGANNLSAYGGYRGYNGENSSIFNLVAIGGGGGANPYLTGSIGGSGGGGGHVDSQAGGSGISGQGYAGGTGTNLIGSSAGGGGGAGGLGGNGNGTTGGAGGLGLVYSISGSPVTYATGGEGGHGTDDSITPNSTDNTGNGGKGGNGLSIGMNGGNGGSGIVIVRYLTN